ncbi:hypothetical protein ACOMHN_023641 [Nucella lapillus]
MSEDFHLKFVKPRNGDLDPRLVEASNMLKEHGLSPEWVDQDQCLGVEAAHRNIAYVMEPFEGPAFEHLKLLGCRLFGPQCILASLNFKMELPQKKCPIYSVCMKGVTISCTSMDKQTRDQVHSLVELMAGGANRNLTDDVTHLVAGEVGSQKYLVAASRNTPIMCVDWVKDMWEIAQHRYVDCQEAGLLQKYRCPIFKGLVITVSGLTQDERHRVKQLVETEGGSYTGVMKMNECTHLILKEPKGQKYDYATKWKTHIVNLSWIYDSLDKNYCQEEKHYPVTGRPGVSTMKTSTPEKSRLSERGREGEGGQRSSSSPHPFLTTSRIYVSSGLQGAMMERCRKMLNASDATRVMKLNESVTHVIMEDKVEDEVDAINDMELKPHVVSLKWLAECVRRGCQATEADFLSPYLLVSETELLKMPKKGETTKRGSGSLSKKRSSSERGEEGEETVGSASEAPAETGGQGDVDIKHLLSQYIDDDSKDGERTVVEPMDEVDGSDSRDIHPAGHRGSDGDDHEHDNDDDDATQDPDGEAEAAEGALFGKKSFTFFGFSEDDVESLSAYVTQAGGVCVSGKRRVADYGVVPILGYPVEQTVGQVVTNAWLQMCLEAEAVLAVGTNPLFRPVAVVESRRPLQGCVLSVSGYTGTERDCLNHIADVLGAVCQEFFVRKAKKSLQASTHLIVKEPSGSKYTAAKNWNIPALTKHWLFTCAQSGEREDEAKFSIDDANDSTLPPEEEEQQPHAGTTEERSPGTQTAEPAGKQSADRTAADSKPSTVENIPASSATSRLGRKAKNRSQTDLPTTSAAENIPESSSNSRLGRKAENVSPTDRNASRTSSAEGAKSKRVPGMVETMATSSASDREHSQGSPQLGNPMAPAKLMVQEQQGRLLPSQKENVGTAVNRAPTPGAKTVNTHTPGGDRRRGHSRVEELQQQSRKPILSPGLDSPSVFMAPGYRPNFDLAGVFEYLKSPDVPQKKRESLPLEEVFQHHLAEGVKNSSVRQTAEPVPSSSQSSQAEDRGPLEGVTIAVSKKLGANQTEYNTIVVELGGDYTWQYSPTCTHFIFQGRTNDLNKEYRQAKHQGKFVVSPHWLYACMEQRCRVDESMYPHSYNPNLNLGGVVKTETPSRGLRRSARSTPKAATPYDRAAAASTPTPTPTTRSTAGSNPKPTAQMVSETWQESMDEMKRWQAGNTTTKTTNTTNTAAAAAKTPRRDTGQSRLGSVVEERSPPNREKSGQSEKSGSAERETRGERSTSVSMEKKALSSSSVSSIEEKSGGGGGDDKKEEEEGAGVEGKEGEGKEASGMEVGGSLEIREALSKTLKSVKASSSSQSKKSSKKRSRRSEANSSGGPMNTSGNLPESATSHHISPWQTQHRAQEGAHTAESLGAEASQSVQITWDDPTERREKERLAHKLEMVCGPSQNTEDFMANMDMTDLDTTPKGAQSSSRPPAHHVRSPTPEAPPLAFPTATVLSKVTSPQPIELLSEESSESHAEPTARPVILTSGMAPQERIEFAEVIERLGGTVLEKPQFDPSCTHVVVVKPSRNEKFLAAVATGRWVLHKSYLIACRQEGKFVREEDHEWGNPAMSHLMQSLDSQTYSLVGSAHKWRQRVQAMRKKQGSSPGAYQGWKVILLTDRKREDNFRRLLTAGGATVLSVRPPFTQVEATHCFVEPHRVKLSESDLEALVTGVTHILKPEFIAAHLTDDPPPSPHNFTPPEVDALRHRMQGEQSRKRKGAAGGTEEVESTKRSRR